MSKYTRTIKGVQVDVYDILKAWEVQNPALQHLIKKALQPGARGHKTLENDLRDILVSAERAMELEGISPKAVPVLRPHPAMNSVNPYNWSQHEPS